MCSYSDYVEQKGIKQGIEQGIEQGIVQGVEKTNVKFVAKLVHSKVMSMEAALDFAEVPNDERIHFTQLVEQELCTKKG